MEIRNVTSSPRRTCAEAAVFVKENWTKGTRVSTSVAELTGLRGITVAGKVRVTVVTRFPEALGGTSTVNV
jgi:hypothetical protein